MDNLLQLMIVLNMEIVQKFMNVNYRIHVMCYELMKLNMALGAFMNIYYSHKKCV